MLLLLLLLLVPALLLLLLLGLPHEQMPPVGGDANSATATSTQENL